MMIHERVVTEQRARGHNMEQERYEIHIKGHLSANWSDWFDGLKVTNLDQGESLITGSVPDQAALHGLLARVYSLNLTLLGVRRVLSESGEQVLPGSSELEGATLCWSNNRARG
jgi:hypothetical protein